MCGKRFEWLFEGEKHSKCSPYKGGNMHRVKWKLEKLSFFEKGKLSIAMSEKCRDEKRFWGFQNSILIL